MRAFAFCSAALIAGALACSLATDAWGNESGRYTVRGEVRALGHSDNGRYALSADLRMTPATASTDGRYALKQVHVPEAECSPLVELFANGFEGN